MTSSFCNFPVQSVRAFLLFVMVTSAILPGRSAHATEQYRDRSVIGKWKLTSVLDFAAVSALDDADAKRLVGAVMTIRPDKLTLGSQVCSASGFWAERVEPNFDLREKAHASAAHLKLPNPVTVVELSCAYVYIKDRNHLVLAWNGAFFDAVRVKH